MTLPHYLSHTTDTTTLTTWENFQKTPATFLVTASWQVRLWRLLDGTVDLVRTMGHSGSARPLLTVARGSDKCWLIEGSQWVWWLNDINDFQCYLFFIAQFNNVQGLLNASISASQPAGGAERKKVCAKKLQTTLVVCDLFLWLVGYVIYIIGVYVCR